jgi:serine/threonine protein kinase
MMPMMLEHFELNSRIAAGGMGTVYRATDTVLKRDVAIKLMQQELAKRILNQTDPGAPLDWFDSQTFLGTLRALLPGLHTRHPQSKQSLWQQKKLRNTSITSAKKPMATAR